MEETVDKKLVSYFKSVLKKKGDVMYVKSKHIAKEIGSHSPKEVGAAIAKLKDETDPKLVKIVYYSKALSTTWKVIRV